MELLGENLSLLRRRQETHAFSLKCTAALAMQMLKGLKQVHDHGFLHRDIKPGNFVMGGAKDPRSVYIIDYGLSRRYVKPDGSLRPKREETRWVGSRRYMSPNTHLRKDQGRRDDMWGFLYVVVELFTGTLPWAHLRGIQNLDKVRDLKLAFMNDKLVEGLPSQFNKILEHIQSLKWADRPNYRLVHSLLQAMYIAEGGTPDTPYDWEDTTRPKSLLGKARLSFSSVHSSNGFSDHVEDSSAETTKPVTPSSEAASGYAKRFHALEDSADFSEDSSARRRKRQKEAIHDQATKAAIAPNGNALDAPIGAADSEPPKKKKKKKRCVIQ
jgi:serine/threonine protein kinase